MPSAASRSISETSVSTATPVRSSSAKASLTLRQSAAMSAANASRFASIFDRFINRFLAPILSSRQATRLPQRLAGHHRDRHGNIERAQALAHGDAEASVSRLMHGLRHA